MVFVTPLVFAFTAEAQFVLVAADRAVMTEDVHEAAEKLALDLVRLTRMTGYPCGTAVRQHDLESCLVGIPIEQPEKSSGRTGLAVVLGVVVSANAHASPRMYHEMLQAVLVPRLLDQLPAHGERNLSAWAEALTREYQDSGGGVLSGESEAEVARVARLYTMLLNGYRRGALGGWSAGDSSDALLLMAQTQVDLLSRSGKGQVSFLVPLASPEAMPPLRRNVTTHRIVDGHVLVCVAGSTRDVFDAS